MLRALANMGGEERPLFGRCFRGTGGEQFRPGILLPYYVGRGLEQMFQGGVGNLVGDHLSCVTLLISLDISD